MYEDITQQERDQLLRSVVRIEHSGGAGSGVVFRRDGLYKYAFTCYHVVDDDNAQYTARWLDKSGRQWIESRAEVLFRSGERGTGFDVAILRFLDSNDTRSPRPVADRNTLVRGGESVYCAGHMARIEPAIVTHGWIYDADQPFIWMDSGLWYGSSGGPVFNSRLEIIGIMARIGFVDGNPDSSQGGFVSLHRLWSAIDLLAGGKSRPPKPRSPVGPSVPR